MRNVRSVFLLLLTIGFVLITGLSPAAGKDVPATNVKMPAFFSSNMVLQQGIKIPVWGWAASGGKVTVSLAGKSASAVAGKDGKWMVRLPSMKAGGPYELTVAGDKTITFTNVMVGEVWICSGQSNMQMPVLVSGYGVRNGEQEIATANHPDIRLLTVKCKTGFAPTQDIESEGWQVCSPTTVPGFSAVGYFFGRNLNEKLGVPIGLINTSWGGTFAEAWTSHEALKTLPDFVPKLEDLAKAIPNVDQEEKAFAEKLAQWEKDVDSHDAGYKDGQPAWAAPGLDAASWATMNLPTFWEKAGLPDVDGYVWFRKEVEVPAAWAGKELVLSLGPINDMDRTWFNGDKVGSTEGPNQATKLRAYPVPGNIVKAGKNVIVVRIQDVGGNGGICGTPDQMKLTLKDSPDKNPLALAGPWRYQVGADIKSLPQKPKPPAVTRSNPNIPTVLYNAMIAPLVPYGIKGAIWYQGESNAARAYQYRSLFPTMIRDWRSHWGEGKFPFLFVQLANWEYKDSDASWPELREAQTMTLSLPKTGMAVIIDIGDPTNIHPTNKQDVGKRLALAGRHVAYGEKLVYSGPLYKSMKAKGDAIRLKFNHVGGGLIAKDGGKLTGLTIAGEDKKFVPADAKIEKDTVVVSAKGISKPVAVRYGWLVNPACNLFNKEGLPASPFRTDKWPGITEKNK